MLKNLFIKCKHSKCTENLQHFISNIMVVLEKMEVAWSLLYSM